MSPKKLAAVALPIRSAPNVMVKGYPDTGDILVRFKDGGFVHDDLFMEAYRDAAHDVPIRRGRATVTPRRGIGKNATDLEIALELENDMVAVSLSDKTCREIEMRLAQVEALLYSYEEQHAA